MNKKFLNEVNTIKKMMGLISEQDSKTNPPNSTSTTQRLSSLTDNQISKLSSHSTDNMNKYIFRANSTSTYAGLDDNKLSIIFGDFFGKMAFNRVNTIRDLSQKDSKYDNTGYLTNINAQMIPKMINGETELSRSSKEVGKISMTYSDFVKNWDNGHLATKFNEFVNDNLQSI